MKLTFTLYTFFAFLIYYTRSSGIELIESNIKKGTLDTRDYRIIKLSNGIEVAIVSDPSTPTSAAALSVGVGSMSDPKDFPGMAHFCEHLCFMGTNKYPSEDEYMSFLLKHDGNFNAFTTLTETSYYFSIDNRYFYEGLDRLAHFFIDPLFREDAIRRESQAVDSEHKKNIRSDPWRLYFLRKKLSNQNHPFSAFSTGSRMSLITGPKRQGKDFREALLKFYNDNYSPQIMKLSIYGKESLDVLSKWAFDLFSKIPNRTPPSPYHGDPFENQYHIHYYYKTLKPRNSITVEFSIPDQYPFYSSQPLTYLQYLLTYNGNNSCVSYLKKKNLGSNILLDYMYLNRDRNILIILVDAGGNKHKHIELVEALFQCINFIKDKSVNREIFDDIKTIQQLNFDYGPRESPLDYTIELASNLHNPYLPRSLLLRAHLLNDYNETEFNMVLGALTPDNFRSSTQNQTDEVYEINDPYYGIEYKVTHHNSSFIQQLKTTMPSTQLAFPPKNTLLTILPNVTMKKLNKPAVKPELIRKTATSSLWHQYESMFHVPRGVIYILLYNPLIHLSPSDIVKFSFLERYMAFLMSAFSFHFTLAGASVSFSSSSQGFQIQLYAYSDILLDLFYLVMKKFRTISIKSDELLLLRQAFYTSYKATTAEAPYKFVSDQLSVSLYPHVRIHEEMMYETKAITLLEFNTFLYEFFTNFHVDIFVAGNVPPDHALHIAEAFDVLFGARPLRSSERYHLRSITMSSGSKYLRKFNLSDTLELNSAINYFIEVGDRTDTKTQATLDVLSLILSQPTFDTLRTKEQLGYRVRSRPYISYSCLGYQILVQSERKPHVLEQRILAFLESMLKYIKDLTQDDINAYIEASVHSHYHLPLSLLEESSSIWEKIVNGTHNFGLDLNYIETIKKVTKKDILSLFRIAFYDTKTKRKLSHHASSSIADFYHFFDLPLADLSAYLEKKSISISKDQLLEIFDISHDTDLFIEELIKHIMSTHNMRHEDVKSHVSDAYSFLKTQFLSEKQKLEATYGTEITNIMLFKIKSNLSPVIYRKSS